MDAYLQIGDALAEKRRRGLWWELFTVEQRDRLDGGEGFMGSKRRVVADLNG